MFKKDIISGKTEYVKQAAPPLQRGRKKKTDSAHSSLASSLSMKGKKPALLAIKFAVPSNIQGDEEVIQYLNDQLSQVIRDIETLQNKKEMISNLLIDALRKKENGDVNKLLGRRSEDEEDVDESRYKFISRKGSDSENNQPQQNQSALRFQDDQDMYHKSYVNDEMDDSFDSSQGSQDNSRSPSNVSQLLSKFHTSKSFIETSQLASKDRSEFFSKPSKLAQSGIQKDQGQQSLTQTVRQDEGEQQGYEKYMVQKTEEISLSSQFKLEEYTKQREKCLWNHFNMKESVKEQLERIDELDEEQLKALAKNFGVKSKNIKQLKEMLQDIYAFLSRSKFPDEYMKEFRPSIAKKIDIL